MKLTKAEIAHRLYKLANRMYDDKRIASYSRAQVINTADIFAGKNRQYGVTALDTIDCVEVMTVANKIWAAVNEEIPHVR